MYVCTSFFNFEQGVELGNAKGVLPQPCYVWEDGLDEMGKDGGVGCSRVHEVTPIRAGLGTLEGRLVFLAPITPQTPCRMAHPPAVDSLVGPLPASKGSSFLPPSGLLKNQTRTWSSPEGIACMKVKLPWRFEPPLICIPRVYEAHTQDAKPKLLRGYLLQPLKAEMPYSHNIENV